MGIDRLLAPDPRFKPEFPPFVGSRSNAVFLGQSVLRFDAGLSQPPAPALAVPIDDLASQTPNQNLLVGLLSRLFEVALISGFAIV